MVWRWIRKMFGPRHEAAGRLAPYFRQMALMDIRPRAPKAIVYDHPIWAFCRGLATHEKPRARFDPRACKWVIPDAEAIRFAKLYSKAGYPGWNVLSL